MNQKQYQNIFRVIADVNLMVENVIQIKSGITISVDVSVKIRQILHMQKRLYLES